MSGKKIVLFATSGGSEFGKTLEELKVSCPDATMVEGKVIRGAVSVEDVRTWTSR